MKIIDSYTVFFERQTDVTSPITFLKKERPPFTRDMVQLLGKAWRAYQEQQQHKNPFQTAADRAGIWVHFRKDLAFFSTPEGLDIRIKNRTIKQIPADVVMCHIYSPLDEKISLYDEVGDLTITIAINPVDGEERPLAFFVVNFANYATIARLVDSVKAKIQVINDEIHFPCNPRLPVDF